MGGGGGGGGEGGEEEERPIVQPESVKGCCKLRYSHDVLKIIYDTLINCILTRDFYGISLAYCSYHWLCFITLLFLGKHHGLFIYWSQCKAGLLCMFLLNLFPCTIIWTLLQVFICTNIFTNIDIPSGFRNGLSLVQFQTQPFWFTSWALSQVHESVSIYLSVCLSVHPFVRLCECPSVCLSVCLLVSLSAYSICLTISLPV